MMEDIFQAVVIGISAGGFQTLHNILPKLPSNFHIPIIIVQHRSPASDNYLITSLDQVCQLKIKEAEEKEQISSGTVYFAPPGYHLLVEKNKTFSLSVDEVVSYARPSIDVLFESAAKAYKSSLIGLIMTGANSDGSKGIIAVKDNGGITVAQDPKTTEISTMPSEAIKTQKIDFIVPLDNIVQFLISLQEDNHE